MWPLPITTHDLAPMKSRLDLGFVAQPRNRPPTSSCCSCHHAARTQPRWPPGPSNEACLSSPHLEASPATTFRACSLLAPTRVKPQPAPAILSQESAHTTLSITHHTRKRPSTSPRTTHGPQLSLMLPCGAGSEYLMEVWGRGISQLNNASLNSLDGINLGEPVSGEREVMQLREREEDIVPCRPTSSMEMGLAAPRPRGRLHGGRIAAFSYLAIMLSLCPAMRLCPLVRRLPASRLHPGRWQSAQETALVEPSTGRVEDDDSR
jgi:hypothetical protein